MRHQRGFTMAEMMIVVAIVGLLLTLGATEYQRMLSKARRAEALGNLEKIHALQLAHYGENHAFGTFREIGFWVDGRARYDYCYGTLPNTCIFAATTGVSGAVTAEATPAGPGVLLAANLFPLFLVPGQTPFIGGNPHVSATTFEVVARGRISPFKALDAWTIDETRELRNTLQGY